jgi:hypothetical protein
LSLRVGDSGKLLIRCHAGCETGAVLSSLGIQIGDLFPEKRNRRPMREVASYKYVDEFGVTQYEVVRYEPKTFRARRKVSSDEYTYDMDGVTRYPYNMPGVIRAQAGKAVFIVEGEKDADLLIYNHDLTASCNMGGAGAWRDEYNAWFKNCQVIILPDNDDPGMKHAYEVAKALYLPALSVRIVRLPVPAKGDVSDFFAMGGSRDALQWIVRSIQPYGPPALVDTLAHATQMSEAIL